MKKLALALLVLPLAGCVVTPQERIARNNCSAVAARESGFYNQNYAFGGYRLYADDYYACLDQSRFTAAYYGYGGNGYAYGYPYTYGYPYAYPNYYAGGYGPAVGVGVGFRGR